MDQLFEYIGSQWSIVEANLFLCASLVFIGGLGSSVIMHRLYRHQLQNKDSSIELLERQMKDAEMEPKTPTYSSTDW